MHYSNVQSGSEKMGVVNIYKKEGNQYIVVLSKSKYGTNERGEFPALEIAPTEGQQNESFVSKSFVKYRGGDANVELGAKMSFCDLPDGLQNLICTLTGALPHRQ